MSTASIKAVLISQHEAILKLLELGKCLESPQIVDTEFQPEPQMKGIYAVLMDNATEASNGDEDRNAIEYCSVEGISDDQVTVSWFYSASEPGSIPKSAWLAAPERARRGFWASNDCELWTLEHFTDVVVRRVTSVSWTGFHPRVEVNVTGYYDTNVGAITKRFTALPTVRTPEHSRAPKRPRVDI